MCGWCSEGFIGGDATVRRMTEAVEADVVMTVVV